MGAVHVTKLPTDNQYQAGSAFSLPGMLPPFAGSEAWIMSLGPYLAPAGSTLQLSFTYTAHFGSWPVGLWRSAAFPSPARQGQQAVALATQFETVFARTVLPCLDEPSYKVCRDVGWDALLGCIQG